MFLFFQAEDGIRDLVRSRGLGDVYKRQVDGLRGKFAAVGNLKDHFGVSWQGLRQADEHVAPVSYTHLTLPTSDLV